jgi:hypothetical protein
VSDGRKEEVISLGDPDGSTYSHWRLIIAPSVRGHYRSIEDGNKNSPNNFEGKKF